MISDQPHFNRTFIALRFLNRIITALLSQIRELITSKNLISIFGAVVLGVICWGSNLPSWIQGLSILLQVLWCAVDSRFVAGLIMMIYSLAASRGLIAGIATFFDTNIFNGFALWFASGILPFCAGWICWDVNSTKCILMIPVLLIVYILPPVGLVGWANPITAAGWIFPGWSWFGLIACMVLAMSLSYGQPIINTCLAAIVGLLIGSNTSYEIAKPNGWEGHNTRYHLGISESKRDVLAEYQRHIELQQIAINSKANVQLFPETVGGGVEFPS
ncbi:MAG: hypothetical protein V4629_10370 [Pseudomonadota bacterium]